MAVVQWCDSKCVTIASTKCGKVPVGEMNCCSRNEKLRLPIPILVIIEDYNANKVVVDIVEVLFHFLDLAILNFLMEHRDVVRVYAKIRQNQVFDFKLEIGEVPAKL